MFGKGKSAVKGDPKRSWSAIETKAGVKYKEERVEVSLVRIH